MSEHKVKQQVRPETNIRKIGKVAHGTGGKGSIMIGLVEVLATADLPADAPIGSLAYDSTASALKIKLSGGWTAI